MSLDDVNLHYVTVIKPFFNILCEINSTPMTPWLSVQKGNAVFFRNTLLSVSITRRRIC